MSRIARNQFLYDGCYAHIISRSIREEKILKDQDDFELFRKLLFETKASQCFKIFHYCLMQTHFHLVVQILSVSAFSQDLGQIKSRYVYAFHKKYKLSGPVWLGRYRSLLIENQGYLLACGKYVEYNPVKAGLVNQIQDWEYSSGAHYLEEKRDDLIDRYDLPELPDSIHLDNEEEFEEGYGIGSEYFKFQLKGKLK